MGLNNNIKQHAKPAEKQSRNIIDRTTFSSLNVDTMPS